MFNSGKIFSMCIVAVAISSEVRAEREVAETFGLLGLGLGHGVSVGVPGIASVNVGLPGAVGGPVVGGPVVGGPQSVLALLESVLAVLRSLLLARMRMPTPAHLPTPYPPPMLAHLPTPTPMPTRTPALLPPQTPTPMPVLVATVARPRRQPLRRPCWQLQPPRRMGTLDRVVARALDRVVARAQIRAVDQVVVRAVVRVLAPAADPVQLAEQTLDRAAARRPGLLLQAPRVRRGLASSARSNERATESYPVIRVCL
ncbi:hypothetical protein PF008_g28886 [Phytophthora fragariae]|uniref:Uncharacterized protein n=1 Tax=Phytophthora fragariae TaxID=53985 RepID=A0A6G0QAJ9_9STRA|nr:hypothetical protein PF008_g28886 [Phytophthora fragariae]